MKTTLCGRPGCGGCPVVEVLTSKVTITNDARQILVMETAEWEELKRKIKAGEFDE